MSLQHISSYDNCKYKFANYKLVADGNYVAISA